MTIPRPEQPVAGVDPPPFRRHDLAAGPWFELRRTHDVIVVQWVRAAGKWIGGAGPLDDVAQLSSQKLPLPAPVDEDSDAERIAHDYLARFA